MIFYNSFGKRYNPHKILWERLKRNSTPSTNYQGQMDFVIPRFNSPSTVSPLQYYVDGDAVDGHQNAIWDLCSDLTTKMQSEYGLIKYAIELFNKNQWLDTILKIMHFFFHWFGFDLNNDLTFLYCWHNFIGIHSFFRNFQFLTYIWRLIYYF